MSTAKAAVGKSVEEKLIERCELIALVSEMTLVLEAVVPVLASGKWYTTSAQLAGQAMKARALIERITKP